jgi:hypothetical protein
MTNSVINEFLEVRLQAILQLMTHFSLFILYNFWYGGTIYMDLKSLIMSLRPFSHRSNIYLSPNLSVVRLFVQKMSVLFSYAHQRLLNIKNFNDSLARMKGSKGSKNSRVALIVANGPSASKIDWQSVRDRKVHQDLDLYLINYAPLDASYKEFIDMIDFLVLSDPEMHPNSSSTKNLRNWERIKEIPNAKLISPTHWHFSIPDLACEKLECLHFNDFSLEGISNNVSPLRGRGYSSLTAYKALSCAIYFGYKRILIIGFDNSGFKDITVDSDLNLLQLPGHALGDYSKAWDCTSHYPGGIGDFLYDYSELFLSLRRCFSSFNVTNLGLDSEVDAFPKIQPVDEYFSLLRKN